jgi:hypothetical protein
MRNAQAIILSLLFLTQSIYAFNQDVMKSNGDSGFTVSSGEEKGETIRWEKQGISFTLPPGWHKDDSLSQDNEGKDDESISVSGLVWRGPRNQRIEFNIETGKKDFPASAREMLEADYENNRSGTVKDLRYMEINGVRGIYYRVPTGSEEEINAYWLTYRHYKGKAQSIGVNLAGSRTETELLMTILNSIRLEQD